MDIWHTDAILEEEESENDKYHPSHDTKFVCSAAASRIAHSRARGRKAQAAEPALTRAYV